MKKIILFMCLLSYSGFAQSTEIKEIFQSYNFDTQILEDQLLDPKIEVKLYFKNIATVADSIVTQKGYFDPQREEGEKWVLTSVDGKMPTKKDAKSFKKNRNKKSKRKNPPKAEPNSFKVEKETDSYIIVSFKYAKKTIPKKYKFIDDCVAYIYFNKESQKAEKTVFKNSEPLKKSILKVDTLVWTLTYNDILSNETALIKQDVLDLGIRLLGQKMDLSVTNNFSLYP